MYSGEPTEEDGQRFLEKQRKREAKAKSTVFKKDVEIEAMRHCECGQCSELEEGEKFEYCCRALTTFHAHLRVNGARLHDEIAKKSEGCACITLSPFFSTVLNEEAISVGADLYDFATKPSKILDNNDRFRFASYRLFVCRTMGWMGSGNRVQLPNCATHFDVRIKKDKKPMEKISEFVNGTTTLTDIKRVSPSTQTSCNEAFHALNIKYRSKDNYYTQEGHDRRGELSIIHWNLSRIEILDGKREGFKSRAYYNKSRKEKVVRKVRTPPSNGWRKDVVMKAREIRYSMTAAPAAPVSRRTSLQYLPPNPHPASVDSNLEEEFDEEECTVERSGEEERDALFDAMEELEAEEYEGSGSDSDSD